MLRDQSLVRNSANGISSDAFIQADDEHSVNSNISGDVQTFKLNTNSSPNISIPNYVHQNQELSESFHIPSRGTGMPEMNLRQKQPIYSTEDEEPLSSSVSAMTTSTGIPSSPAMSLQYSAICSSISSLFTNDIMQDHLNLLTQSTSTCTAEDEQLQSVSRGSDGDAIVGANTQMNGSAHEDDAGINSGENVPGIHELCEEPGINRHDFNSFRNVAMRLLAVDTQDDTSQPNSIHTDLLNEYWVNLSKEDWDNFERTAKEVLHVLDPSANSVHKIPVPPSPPIETMSDGCRVEGGGQGRDQLAIKSLRLESFLPSEFMCSLCHRLVVGATTLDCGCMRSFCISCIETYDEDMGEYLGMDQSCPSCHSPYHYNVPCHALDVAILKSVKELKPRIGMDTNEQPRANESLPEHEIKKFQSIFYTRLLLWRQEVLRRHARFASEQEQRQQQILSRHVDYEKEVLRRCEMSKKRKLWFQRTAEMSILVATFVFVSVRTLLRSR